MSFTTNHTHLRSIFALILISTLSFSAFAGNNFGKSPYHNDPNPIRVYYFGYNMMKPGFGIGTELNLLWTKMEKTGCKGSRISDRKLLFVPNLGMFQNEANSSSVYGNLEIDYKVTFRGGVTFEMFGAAGYAQMLSKEESSNPDAVSKGVLSTEAHSGFMPEAGLGIGYDFQKVSGKDFPLAINFRALATSTNIAEMDIFPSFQTGLIYSF
ncbi:MAG: hypothetical protein IPI31_16440 [Bacteroidetes bacterium]|jgi:hypothetical protein|nr:hypothetical protein [Bacteroidota bacterium]MBK7569411.1 hypothetical protein [Bacteroidota bacterium]MBP8915950.1 hypothetical protein [Chitinophagales bacterium]MBP9795206.1 hypothetical protein [Chitinophagales bacterium]